MEFKYIPNAEMVSYNIVFVVAIFPVFFTINLYVIVLPEPTKSSSGDKERVNRGKLLTIKVFDA